jgi:hypothetical protein
MIFYTVFKLSPVILLSSHVVFLSAESNNTIVQTVTSCFIRKVKLYLNVLKILETKFKKRWIKSVCYCVLNFSYFEHLSFILISNGKKHICVIHISQKLKVKITKKVNYKPYAFRVPHTL